MFGGRSGGDQRLVLPAWAPPLIVAAIAVAIVGGFYVGGPGLGLAVGALAATAVLTSAVRATPRGPIVPAPLHDFRRHVLLVSRTALEDPRTIAELRQLCAPADPDSPSEVRLLVPTSGRFIARWTGERRPTYEAAQRRCVLSLAALTKAGLSAQAGVGDEDIVQAVEDELRTFPATDVVLITDQDGRVEGEAVATELRDRLETDFLHLEPAVGRPGERRGPRSDLGRKAEHRRQAP